MQLPKTAASSGPFESGLPKLGATVGPTKKGHRKEVGLDGLGRRSLSL